LAQFEYLAAGVIVVVMVIISALLIVLFRILVVRPLRETGQLMDGLAQGHGDLTVELPIRFQDDIGELRISVNRFTQQLRHMIRNVASQISKLQESSEQLQTFSTEQRINSDAELRETTQVANSMGEMTSAVEEVTQNASAAASAAQKADVAAHDGSAIVDGTVAKMRDLAEGVQQAAAVIHELEEDSGSIGAVLDVIRGIAEQTNLLALNAAIEAARAGEQGRGFAVVADEVRTLASRTGQSTQEIEGMIKRLQLRASDAVKAMEDGRHLAQQGVEQATNAGKSLNAITDAVDTINSMNAQIASAAEEQSATSAEVSRNIGSLNDLARDAATYAERTAAASENLRALADQLHGLIGQFKI
jgi:methyl-accepting chemotaxis protein